MPNYYFSRNPISRFTFILFNTFLVPYYLTTTMEFGLTFLAIAFVGIVCAQNEDVEENRDSLLNQNLARFIKADYTNFFINADECYPEVFNP